MPGITVSEALLSQAAKELVREQGLEKTTVLQITQRAGLNRQTFYKRFTDKFNLINWICYTEFIDLQKEVLTKGGWAAVSSILQFFENDRIFYGSVLQETGQNSFGSYIVEVFKVIIYNFTGDTFRQFGLNEKEVEGISRELADDFRSAVVFWLLVEPEKNAEQFFEVLSNAARAFSGIVCSFSKTFENAAPCDQPIALPMQYLDDSKRLDIINDLNLIER